MQKVAVFLKHKKNSVLLEEFLDEKYEVVQCTKVNLFEKCYDLIIIDDFILNEISSDIEIMKKRQDPIFLPFLLITSYKGENIIKDNPLCKKVDDFVKTPIDKSELAYRVNSLLEARKLSIESDRRYYALTENLPLGVCIIQNQKFVYVNSILAKKNTKEKIVGTPFINYIHPEDQEKALKYYQEMVTNHEKKSSSNLRIVDNNETRWINFHAQRITHKAELALLIIILDITEKIIKDAHVEYLSYHDGLTGVYNKTFFVKELERIEKQNMLPLTIIMGDVNNLKLVNDAFGHVEGDKLIKKVAGIIQECCRKDDIVVRWGGDEFMIILHHAYSTDAAKVCKRIKESLDKTEDIQIKISIALGYATKDTKEQSVEEILKEAENRMYRNKLTENASTRHAVIDSLNKTLKEKSFETEEHTIRLQKLAVEMGKELRLSDDKLDELSLLASLHDIGKVGIPEKILLKTGKLSPNEWEIIKKHPEIGYRIVKSIPELAHVAEAILSHHEKWDGSGYPRGLKGNQIPTISRIISIIDAYDVMTHNRAYKKTVTQYEAIKEIKKCTGHQFDPDLVNHFIRRMETCQ